MKFIKKYFYWIKQLMKLNNIPIIVVSGATGTGKTKLSVEIAKHYNGEIINADALQVYKGLDIATNKATESERQGIDHHLLGFVDVNTLDFTIHQFQKLALEKIEDIRSRNKMPILVGGTNYYIESILWPTLINVQNQSSEDLTGLTNNMNNDELYLFLQTIDSQSAQMLHPNNRRKVLRAVQIACNSKKTQFDYLNEQEKSRRFNLNEVVLLWIHSTPDCLFPRLDKRVQQMVDMGLLSELEEIQSLYTQINPPGQYTQGIFQAIGFKEFHDYLNFQCSHEQTEQKEKILQNCIDKLKLANKQYVKVQNKWVRNRFLRQRHETENIPLFKLDSSNVSLWDENVLLKSIKIIDQIIEVTNETNYTDFVAKLSIPPEKIKSEVTYTPCHKICDICDGQIFTSEQQWLAHFQSRRHEKRKKKSKLKHLELKSSSS